MTHLPESSLTLERLYHPDSVHLGSLVAGTSGSGKTTACITTMQEAIKSPSFGEKHRFCVIDPKCQPGDWDLLGVPHTSSEAAIKRITKDRVVVLWPDLEFLEAEVSDVVNYLFTLSDSDPDSSFTFILDEASILITPQRIPTSLKRLSVQGRGKRIKPVFISQRPIINRWTDANLSNLLMFRTLPVDSDTLSKRWGVDFEQAEADLSETPFSFLWFNMESGAVKRIPPVPLPKPAPKPKPSILRRITSIL